MRRSRPQPPAPAPAPLIFELLCQTWGVSPVQQYFWWRALTQAPGEAVVTWRQLLTDFHPERYDTLALLEQDCGPQRVVGVLELLVEAQCLSRLLASRIEARLLDHINKHGQWVLEPPIATQGAGARAHG